MATFSSSQKCQDLTLAQLAVLALALFGASAAYGQAQLTRHSTVVFATAEEGAKQLSVRDDFIVQMSPFDRAVRMKADKDVSEQDLLRFIAKQVLPWEEADKTRIRAVLDFLRPRLEQLSVPLPRRIYLIKTTGREEADAPYTRGNAIVLPAGKFDDDATVLRRVIAHELFHLMSRSNPAVREKLYRAIGFQKCGEFEFPAPLKARRMTNPDAPRNDHCIWVQSGGKSIFVVPIEFSITEKYDTKRGGDLFDYLQLKFLILRERRNGKTVEYDPRNPKLVGLDEISGLFEQIGMNPDYVSHPEEILADNFALLLLGTSNAPSPEVLNRIRKILTEAGTANPAPAKPDLPKTFRSALVVIATSGDEYCSGSHFVYESMFFVDPTRPVACPFVFERFGFANSAEGVLIDGFNKPVDPL